MNDFDRKDCLERAGWYVDRMEDLLRFMNDRPRMDSDDVQQCQSMLREILAKFRSDRRPQPPGRIAPMLEQNYLWAIFDAGEHLRVTASSRPSARWRDELTECKTRIGDYFDKLALS